MGEATAETASIEEARGWIGWRLDEVGGARAGRVEGIYIDAQDGAPVWLLARMGRFGHWTAVPHAFAAGAAGRVWLPLTREQMRAAPSVDPGEPLTRELELELCRAFEIPEGAGRAAQLASRRTAEQTALPDVVTQ